MNGRPKAAGLFVAILLIGSLVATPTTSAAPGPDTTTKITTPADPAFFDVTVDPNTDTTADTIAVAGTATFDVTTVDIDCLSGRSVSTLASAVPVTAGNFSTVASLQSIWGSSSRLCKLLAIPAGSDPTSDSLVNYIGPRVALDGQVGSTVSGGTNAGTLYDYALHAQQFTGAFDYHSLGNGGVGEGSLFDPYFARTTETFSSNAALFDGLISGPTRSELRIDGANAYTPDGADAINANATGLPDLSYSYSFDSTTHDLVVHETDPLVRCPDPAYPPNATSCASFVSTGVTDHRTITQDHDGHVAWVSDVFTSTDGHAHLLDLLWDNGQRFFGTGSDAARLEYLFPGESGYSQHAVDDAVSLPASWPGTILVRMSQVLDGDPDTGQGAIVYDRAATSANFDSIDFSTSDFTLHQAGTVPAGGSTRFRFAYVQDYLAANVAALAQAASTSFLNTLTVSKSGAGSGTVTSSPAGISCGSSCSHAYPYGTSVTLTAAPATGSAFTGWAGACSGTGPCVVTTNDATAATAATFSIVPETLTVTKAGDGGGTVTSSPAGISCGGACSHSYDYGTSLTLSTSAAPGSSFAGWSGACTGKTACKVTMTAARSITATFLADCLVPKVTGKSLRAAKRALSAHDCRAGKITRAFSAKVKRGRVISQRPKSHKHLAHGAKVALVISKGKR